MLQPNRTRHAREGTLLVLEPHRAKDFTLPSTSRIPPIAAKCREIERPAAPAAFHMLTEPANDAVLRSRLAPVNFDTMRGHPVPEMDGNSGMDNIGEECEAEPGPGAYDPLVWLQVRWAISSRSVYGALGMHPLFFMGIWIAKSMLTLALYTCV